MQDIDLLVSARWVIPVEPADTTLEYHSVAISDGDIVAVVDTAEAAVRFTPREQVRLPHHVLVPGLVNAHTHAAMTLFRGLADDLPLMQWLEGHIWPAEQRWVDPGFVRCGTRLAMIEMLRCGTTCFNDMYFFPDVVGECAEAAGMRACVGLLLIDAPTVWAQTADEYFSRAVEVHDRLRHSPLVTTAFAPHAPYTVGDESLTRMRKLADELDLPIHMHVHETAHEIEVSMARFGVRPLERLGNLGLLTPRLQAVHMTQLLGGEIEALAEAGVHVLHCPESNLKLASGFCPVADLRDAGVNVAVGTDGAASNNDLDMIGELRTAALLAKGVSGRATALPAHAALEMATLAGARALGLEERIGSLVAGKAADLTAIDLEHPETQPVHHPIAQIVYSAHRTQVSDVWVNGRRVLERHRPTTLDTEGILRDARERGERIAASDEALEANP